MKTLKILVVGPSRKTRGGITSVIFAHSQHNWWKDNNTFWIESYRDGSAVNKIVMFIIGFTKFLVALPHSNKVIIHIALGTSAIRKSIFYLAALVTGKKIVFHFHTPGSGEIPKDIWKVGWMFRRAEKIIVLSKSWASLLHDVFPSLENIVVIENPSPLLIEPINKEKRIVFLGTLDERKGYLTLLKAFSNLPNSKDWILDVCGNGNLKFAKQLVQDLGIEKRVVFHGWVNFKERDLILKKASIFCLPSFAEGLPVSLLEAVAYRCAVITTAVGGIPDYFSHGINAELIQPGNERMLTDSLDKVISNEKYMLSLINEGLNVYTSFFDPELIEAKYSRVIYD